MPAQAKLVTLTQAKAQLGITLPAGDPGDVELQDRLDAAEAMILDRVKSHPDYALWTDPVSAPGAIVEAIKVLLTYQQMDRGDKDTDPEYLWCRIDLILAQYHTPAVA